MKRMEGYPTEVVKFDDSWRVVPTPHPAELYNLEDDPLERNNLSEKYPDLVKQLTSDFEKWFNEVEEERMKIEK
jgi:arylsulfatase A